jgi:hypothetical protein
MGRGIYMSDSKQSISGKGKYEEGWLGVSPLEKEKRQKDEILKIDTDALLYSAFIILLKQFRTSFASNPSLDSTLEQEIHEALVALRKLLQILTCEDQSHNPEYTELLSTTWHDLMQSQIKNFPELASLKEDLNNYPASEEHSLGFYLAADTGKEWHPFPFMEMLHQLHLQHRNNPAGSELHHWIELLDRILKKD